ncbi:hypothetical protein F1D61_30400 [Methylobacterium aquaticum]|nr:hypothetical protein F1D61_30400 [Methylobacterium aquaticum]
MAPVTMVAPFPEAWFPSPAPHPRGTLPRRGGRVQMRRARQCALPVATNLNRNTPAITHTTGFTSRNRPVSSLITA